MNTESQWSKQEAFLHVRLGCGLLSITTTVSLLVNEFDVRRVLHGQVSLAAINQICVIHEAMNGCKKIQRFIRPKRKCLFSGYPTDPNILGPTQTFLKPFGILKYIFRLFLRIFILFPHKKFL